MREPKTFCEQCRKYEQYNVSTEVVTSFFKGGDYIHDKKTARCAVCGTEVDVAQLADENLQLFYDAYREAHGLISLEHTRELFLKYDIGKKPLSKLLGWGEMTYSRYCDGALPTKQYGEVLQRLYDEPDYYLQLLEENRNRITTAAYEKSRRAAMALLGTSPGNPSKVDTVIAYILFQGEDITPLALQKALYYVQGFYYAFSGEFLFHEDFEAWVHGPVLRDVYRKYADYRFDSINCGERFDLSQLTDSEKVIIDCVVKHLCCYSGKTLEGFTHNETPWLTARGDIPANQSSDRPIPKEEIGRYFSEVKQKFNMLIPADIEHYAKEMFTKIDS